MSDEADDDLPLPPDDEDEVDPGSREDLLLLEESLARVHDREGYAG
jgi:hypothetical protein